METKFRNGTSDSLVTIPLKPSRDRKIGRGVVVKGWRKFLFVDGLSQMFNISI